MAARERRSPPQRRIAPRKDPSAVGPHKGHPTGTAGEGPRGPAEDEARWWMALVASAEDAIHGTTLDGRILGWNRGAERLYGYTAEEVVGRPVAMLCPPDRLDEARQFLDRVGQGQVVRQIETLRVRKDGCVIEVELTISPVRDAAGRVIGASSITRDTSERKRARAALRESEERFRLVVENIPVHIWVCSLDDHLRYGNRRWLSYLGMTSDQMQAGGCEQIVHPDDWGPARIAWERSVREGVDYEVKLRLRGADGQYRWFLARAFPLRDARGAIDCWYGTNIDIDEAVRTEQALWEGVERMRLAMQAANFCIFDYDFTTGRMFWSSEFKALFGLAPDAPFEIDQDLMPVYLHPDDRPRMLAISRAANGPHGSGVIEEEHRIIRADDGTIRWLFIKGRTSFAGEGAERRPIRHSGVVLDITQRRRAEQALRENEERLRLAMEAGRTFAFEWDVATDEVRWSENRAEILGVSCDPIRHTGTGFFAQVHPDDRERLLAAVRALTPSSPGYQITYRFLRCDGGVATLAETGRGLFDASGRLVRVVGMSADVTEQRRAEQALRESESRLRAIVDTAADGIITIDERGTIVAFNAAAERIFGYKAHEVLGREVNLLMPSPHREQHGRYLARYRSTGVARIIGTVRELVGRRRDGTIFPIELSVGAVDKLGLFTGIVRDITDRRALQEQLLTIAEAEQRRIGQDLHDDIGQELTGLGLLVAALLEALDEAHVPEAGLAARIRTRLDRVQERIRALCRGLFPVEVDAHGLMAALEDLTGSIGMLQGIECTFACRMPVPVEDRQTAMQLYRIAQEAIANAIKHGQARHIHVSLQAVEDRIHLEVRDDGAVIPDESRRGHGIGLKIMHYRADLIGARLEVGPAAGGGTRVECSIAGGSGHGRQRDESG